MATDTPLKKAAKLVGTEAALAEAIGCTRQRLHQWHRRGIPTDFVPLIERATGGQIRCEELKPEVAWDVLRPNGGA